jgi:hypothetical protein
MIRNINILLGFSLLFFTCSVNGFNLDTGVAIFDFIRNVTDLRLEERPVPIQIRITDLIPSCAWDAIAPYTATGNGIITDVAGLRRPSSEFTDRNQNIATFYALYRLSLALQPQDKQFTDDYMIRVGLNPLNDSTDPTSPVGIGNIVGQNWVEFSYTEGANQLGDTDHDGSPRAYNRRNFSDTTGYFPVNTPDFVFNLNRWQPYIESINNKWIIAQTYVVPQLGNIPTFADVDIQAMVDAIPNPIYSYQFFQFISQAQEVIDRSAQLNDTRKMLAEFYDAKSNIPFVIRPLLAGGFNTERYTKILLITGKSTYDAIKFMWRAKSKFDSVRPFTVINTLYKNQWIQSWGGPGKGTVWMKGNEWAAYIRSDAFPEYPSATTCVFTALAQATRLLRGNGTQAIDDNYPVSIEFEKGSSIIEPGITPSQTITVQYNSLTEIALASGESRIDAGVHFRPAVENIANSCTDLGTATFERYQQLLGNEPLF